MDKSMFVLDKVEYTRVTSGEPEEIEYSRWKVKYRIPLFSKNGTRLCNFYIVSYSYEARCVELREIPRLGDIDPATYFEIYNVHSGKIERIKQSGDKFIDTESLKHLLGKLYLDLEEITQ